MLARESQIIDLNTMSSIENSLNQTCRSFEAQTGNHLETRLEARSPK